MRIRKIPAHHVLHWIGCGWRFWRRNPIVWLLVGLAYVAFVALVTRLPFFGILLALLVTPVLGASCLLTVHQQVSRPRARSEVVAARAWAVQERLKLLFKDWLTALFRCCTMDDKLLGLMAIGFGTMIAGVLVKVVTFIIGGTSVYASVSLLDMGMVQGLRILVAYGVMFLFYMALVALSVHMLGLYVIRDVPLPTALVSGLRACRQNSLPCLALVSALVLPVLLAGLALDAAVAGGFVLLVVVGLVAIPLFINSAYCSYRVTYY